MSGRESIWTTAQHGIRPENSIRSEDILEVLDPT